MQKCKEYIVLFFAKKGIDGITFSINVFNTLGN